MLTNYFWQIVNILICEHSFFLKYLVYLKKVKILFQMQKKLENFLQVIETLRIFPKSKVAQIQNFHLFFKLIWKSSFDFVQISWLIDLVIDIRRSPSCETPKSQDLFWDAGCWRGMLGSLEARSKIWLVGCRKRAADTHKLLTYGYQRSPVIYYLDAGWF